MKSIWIARDKDGTLNLFGEEPQSDGSVWDDMTTEGCLFGPLDSSLYPEVTYNNSPKELIVKP